MAENKHDKPKPKIGSLEWWTVPPKRSTKFRRGQLVGIALIGLSWPLFLTWMGGGLLSSYARGEAVFEFVEKSSSLLAILVSVCILIFAISPSKATHIVLLAGCIIASILAAICTFVQLIVAPATPIVQVIAIVCALCALTIAKEIRLP